jgi:hypothetical protein
MLEFQICTHGVSECFAPRNRPRDSGVRLACSKSIASVFEYAVSLLMEICDKLYDWKLIIIYVCPPLRS